MTYALFPVIYKDMCERLNKNASQKKIISCRLQAASNEICSQTQRKEEAAQFKSIELLIESLVLYAIFIYIYLNNC